MEQRWSPRTNVNIDVDLQINGEEISGCKTRDIGMGGVFVEVHSPLPNDDKDVELTFNLMSGMSDDELLSQAGKSDNLHILKATVVRVTEDGVGLMFRDFDASAFRSLQQLLHYVQNEVIH